MRLWIIFLSLVAIPAVAQDLVREANATLAQYHGLVLALKNPYEGSKLEFTSGGHLKTGGKIRTIVNSGFIYADTVTTDGHEIKVKGLRCVLTYNRQRAMMEAVVAGPKVELRIQQTSLQPTDLASAMHSVFQDRNSRERLAKYWQPAFDPAQDWIQQTEHAGDQPIGTLDGNRPVYRVRVGVVSPPKIVSAPDPAYPDKERNLHTRNTSHAYLIVDENGDPALISVSKSTQDDFDTAMAAGISHWKFTPARKDGKPVAVLINVEVNFRVD